MTEVKTNSSIVSDGVGRISAGVIGALIARYVVSSLETKYGVSIFDTIGISPDLFKDSITGTVSGIAAGLTPSNLVKKIVNVILFMRGAYKEIDEAIHQENVPDVINNEEEK